MNVNTLSDKLFKEKFPGANHTSAWEATVQIGNQTFYWQQLDDKSWWNIEIRTVYKTK